MTRKDYRLLAEYLSKGWPIADGGAGALKRCGYDCAILTVADALQSDNANFKRETFLKAAGVAS